MDAIIRAAADVVQSHGAPGAGARLDATYAALDAADPALAVVIAAARWTDRYGRAGAATALRDLFDAVEAHAEAPRPVPTVTIPADEHERLLTVVQAARDWSDALARPGEGCPDCGASGEPAAEKRLDDAVTALWTNDGRSHQ